MTAAVYDRTENIKLGLIQFNFPNWSDDANMNMELIDGALGLAGITVDAIWQNSTPYTTGMLVIDATTNTLYRCDVTHTSAPYPTTFEQDRIDHPGYWHIALKTIAVGVTVSDVPPPPPLSSGQLWWESDEGNLHVWYNDGNSSQWVQVNTGPQGGEGPRGIQGVPGVEGPPGPEGPPGVGSADTPETLLAKLITVDGTGSGLDSDLLDGQSGAYYLSRNNHTGTQAINTVTNLQTTLDGKEPSLPAGGTSSNFLRGDKTWQPVAAGVTDGDKGDIVVSGSGASWLFDSTVVTATAKTLLDDTSIPNMLITLGALPSTSYTAADVLAKLLTVDGTGSLLDADLLDGQSGAYYTNAANMTGALPAGSFSDTTHGNRAGGTLHPAVTTSVNGFMISTDKSKLDGIQTGATDDLTAAEILTALKTVDGTTSGLDADLLDGLNSTAFAAASHTHVQADVTNLVSDLALKAPLASPVFTGNPVAPTPTVGDNDTSIATTAFVAAAVAAGGGSSVTISDTAPGSPTAGALWWESDVGNLLIYYNDGNTSQWVPANALAGVTVAPDWASVTGKPIPQSDVATLVSDLALLAPKASPTFTGTTAAPLAAVGDNSTQIATTAWYRSQYLTNSVVFDPPSAATGVVGVIQTLTVTGAALGDYCLASFSVDLNGMTLLAWVSATNTVKFQFQNKTAGTLDLASGTVRVRVWKQ